MRETLECIEWAACLITPVVTDMFYAEVGDTGLKPNQAET